jgi:hypothetical protein
VTIAFTKDKHPFIHKLDYLTWLQKRYWNKVNNRKEKTKMKLFPTDSVLELNTKNLDNSPRFLTITHMTLSAKGLEVTEF